MGTCKLASLGCVASLMLVMLRIFIEQGAQIGLGLQLGPWTRFSLLLFSPDGMIALFHEACGYV